MLFGYLVAFGELLACVALVPGLFTRWAALALVFMAINSGFTEGTGFWAPGDHGSLNTLIALMLFFTITGHTPGADDWRARRRNA